MIGPIERSKPRPQDPRWDPNEVIQVGPSAGRTLGEVHDERLAALEAQPLPLNRKTGEVNQSAEARRNLFEDEFYYYLGLV